jgi:hypothetical protein
MDNVAYFHEKPNKYEKKDLNQFRHIREFNDATEEARIKLTKGELKKQANKLYETDRYLIVEPTSHPASCFYGAGTRWCTTMKGTDTYFNNYYKTNTLFYFINKRNGKKRAFLTPLGRPMFGGSITEPNYEYHSGSIFTEADNYGRSMRGIPIEGRAAMAKRHAQKSLEKDPSLATKLRFGQKVLTRIVRTDLTLNSNMGITQPPNSFKKVEGNMNLQNGITSPNKIKEVTGNVQLHGVNNMGDLETVGGNLKINQYLTSLGGLKYIGGDLDVFYGRTSNLESLGDLEVIEGTFYWEHFPQITVEDLQKLDKIGEVKVSRDKFNELTGEIRLPNLPNTPLEIV